MPVELYSPPDVDEAFALWGANCGPCALAAVLRVPVAGVRALLPDFERRRYTNPTHLKRALTASRRRWHPLGANCWPDYGLAFVQLEGPWENPGVPAGAAYRHTHWIAVAHVGVRRHVYDVNNRLLPDRTDWQPLAAWEAGIVPALLANTKRATGWRVRSAIEVAQPSPRPQPGE